MSFTEEQWDDIQREAIQRAIKDSVRQNADATMELARKQGAVDTRRFALDSAIRFIGRDATHINNSTAVLLCAEQFHRWLDQGTMPDVSDAVRTTHEWAWHLVRGLFPESEIQRAMQQNGGEK